MLLWSVWAGEMKIRKATTKDIERINEIYSEGALQEIKLQYHKYSNTKISEEVEFEIKKHKKTIRKNLKAKKQHWVVLEEKEKVLGFGSLYIWRDKAVIESVYISKEYQKKGYGTIILKYLINWIKLNKVKHIESNLFIKNKPSLKLHQKLGFKAYLLRMRLR